MGEPCGIMGLGMSWWHHLFEGGQRWESEVCKSFGNRYLEYGSDGDNEDMEKDPEGEDCERLALHKESREVRKLMDPLLPSEREVEDHWVRGHLPYRNWCHVCVRSRGRAMDHQKDKGKERKLPEYHFEYCFPGDEFGLKWTISVGPERVSKSWFATAVPQKGASGRFATDKCMEFFEENGHGEGKVIIKTDQEPSTQYLVKDIVDTRKEGRTIVEESPVKSSGSNGVVERSSGSRRRGESSPVGVAG